MLFEEAYNEFLIYVEKRHKKQGFRTISNNFNNHILPYFINKSLYDIKKSDIINWQNIIYEKNFSNSYNNNLYVAFNEFLNFCSNLGYINFNYLKDIGNFKKRFEEKKTDFYTLEEFNHFIKFVDDEVYKQFFNLMFFTGTRPGEAMALKFSDLKEDYIFITKTLTTKGGRSFDTPKNQSSIRKIKIDKFLYKDLINLKSMYIKRYGDCFFDYYIFGGKKYLSPTTINRRKKEACINANIREITLHQFRHSHATLLLQNNVFINEVSRRLGHSDVSMTLNVYSHTDLIQEKKSINTLNSLRFNFFRTISNNFKKIIYLLKH